MNLLLVDSTNQATSSSKFSPLTSGKVRIAGINYTTEETSTGSTPVWTATYSVNEKNTNEQTRKISPIYVPSSNDIKDDNMKNSPYLAFSKGFILDGIDAYYSYATGSGKTVIDRGLLYHDTAKLFRHLLKRICYGLKPVTRHNNVQECIRFFGKQSGRVFFLGLFLQ